MWSLKLTMDKGFILIYWRYATDAVSGGLIRILADLAKIPV